MNYLFNILEGELKRKGRGTTLIGDLAIVDARQPLFTSTYLYNGYAPYEDTHSEMLNLSFFASPWQFFQINTRFLSSGGRPTSIGLELENFLVPLEESSSVVAAVLFGMGAEYYMKTLGVEAMIETEANEFLARRVVQQFLTASEKLVGDADRGVDISDAKNQENLLYGMIKLSRKL